MRAPLFTALAAAVALTTTGAAFGQLPPGSPPPGTSFPPIDIFEGTGPNPEDPTLEMSMTPLPFIPAPGNVVLLDTLTFPANPFDRSLWSDVLVFGLDSQHPNLAIFFSDIEGQPFNPPALPGPFVFYLETTDPVIHPVPGTEYFIHSDPVPAPTTGALALAGAGLAGMWRRRRA